MSIKCVSLGTAKALKEAGFPQTTHFCWFTQCSKTHQGFKNIEPQFITMLQPVFEGLNMANAPCAPTSDEILEELPKKIVNKDGMAQWLKINPIGNDWMVVYDPVDEGVTDNFIWCGETRSLLCEALASMWISLKKENLL